MAIETLAGPATDENSATTGQADNTHRNRNWGARTRRREQLMVCVLRAEADGAKHSGVEIDRMLADAAPGLGYSDDEVSRRLPKTGRSAFANDGDWAKAKLTAERLHEVVGRTVHMEGDIRLECNVYRITFAGLDELRRRSMSKTPNPAAQALGRLGGSRNTPAQVAARLANAKRAGRPRRVCVDCGHRVYGGHKNPAQNAVCHSTGWRWQKPREYRTNDAYELDGE